MLSQITGKKRIIIISVFVVIFLGCGNFQKTAFQYNGNPVHPLLVKGLLPNPETTTLVDCVNLDSTTNFSNLVILNDSSTVNSGPWITGYYSNTGYTGYHYVSKYKNYFCIVVRDVDGSFPMSYVFFLSIRNNKLCLNGFLEVANIRDNLVTISGDSLMIGSEAHSINSIINSKMNN